MKIWTLANIFRQIEFSDHPRPLFLGSRHGFLDDVQHEPDGCADSACDPVKVQLADGLKAFFTAKV